MKSNRLHLTGPVSVSPSEFLVVYRRGKPRIASRGATAFCIPFLDIAVRVPTDTHQVDFSADQITAENQGIEVDGFAVWRVDDPLKACAAFSFEDPEMAAQRIGEMIKSLVESATRHQVAKMSLEDTLRKRGSIILALKEETAHVTSEWGIALDTVEIRTVKILSRHLFENLQAQFRENARHNAEVAALESSRRIKEKRITEEEAIALVEQEVRKLQIVRNGELDRCRHKEAVRSLVAEALSEAERNRLSILGAEGAAAVAQIGCETRKAQITVENLRDAGLHLIETLPDAVAKMKVGEVNIGDPLFGRCVENLIGALMANQSKRVGLYAKGEE